MADYTPRSRSNYFEVTDVKELHEIAKLTGADIRTRPTGNGTVLYAMFHKENSESAVDFYYDKELEEHIGIHEKIQAILPKGEKAVFMEIGYDKLRCFVVDAVIVTSEAIATEDFFTIIKEKYNIEQLF